MFPASGKVSIHTCNFFGNKFMPTVFTFRVRLNSKHIWNKVPQTMMLNEANETSSRLNRAEKINRGRHTRRNMEVHLRFLFVSVP
jgi:hypothetical protein